MSHCCDELRRVLALLERESEVMENKEQYEEAVKMLQGGFDRIRSLRSQQAGKKRSHSSDEATHDIDLSSKLSVSTESIKPAPITKKDSLIVVKTYPFVDLTDNDAASSDVQPPPRKKVRFAESSEDAKSTAPTIKFQGTQGDIYMMIQKLAPTMDNKLCPASVRLHLPDAPTIHEHEAIIDAILGPYFAIPRSEGLSALTRRPHYIEDCTIFSEAVGNLTKLWAQYFGLGEAAAREKLWVPTGNHSLGAWTSWNEDLRRQEDWYSCWAIGLISFLGSLVPTPNGWRLKDSQVLEKD